MSGMSGFSENSSLRVSTSDELHIYIHIPFCISRCHFCCYMCSFSISEITNLDLLDKYVFALESEIESSETSHRSYQSIVFGGGTPTILSRTQIKRIMNSLMKRFLTPSHNGATLSFETSPELGTTKKLQAFRSAGFGRVSIGAQALNDFDLYTLGRRGAKKQIVDAYINGRTVGFDSVNIDIMMGFPGHHLDNWKETVRSCIALEPDSISINPFLAGMGELSKWVAKKQRYGVIMPSAADREIMLCFAFDELHTAGYSNTVNLVFSKPGHDFSYIRDTFSISHSVKAFGAGIKSFEDDYFVLSDTGIQQYINKPSSGRRAHDYKRHFRSFVRNGLIAHSKLNTNDFLSGVGVGLMEGLSQDDVASNIVDELLKNGLAEMTRTTLTLNSSRICEAILYLLNYFDENWE